MTVKFLVNSPFFWSLKLLIKTLWLLSTFYRKKNNNNNKDQDQLYDYYYIFLRWNSMIFAL